MKLFWFVLALMIGGVFAEPVPVGTKGEVQKAKGLIDDLVASGADAEKLVSMAAETEKGSERFWLYSNAFILQTKEGKYAEATETLKALQQNVTDIPEVNIVNLIERNVGKKVAEVPELAAILKESKARLAAQRLVPKLKKDIRKNPKDAALKASLGEAFAVCGDWKAALEAFAEAKGKLADIVNAELQGKRTMGIAGFWWDYKHCRELTSSKAFKAHAADIYTELLKDDQLSVVEKTLAEKRIAEVLGGVKTDEKEKSYETPERVAVNTASTKSKDEFSELKKICDTRGLTHCWRFNGNLKDCAGGSDAKLEGCAKSWHNCAGFSEGYSNIDLGSDILSKDDKQITIELWVAASKIRDNSRIITIGQDLDHRLTCAWEYRGFDIVVLLNGYKNSSFLRPAFGPFEMHTEYHFALVMIQCNDGEWECVVYKQNSISGETITKRGFKVSNGWSPAAFAQKYAWLGRSFSGEPTASALYNEVRIWNRALDEQELTQNAINFHKAGETMKISGEPRRFVGGGNSSAGRETRRQSKLTPEELKKIVDAENAYDKKMLERKFGKEGLDRINNSSGAVQ